MKVAVLVLARDSVDVIEAFVRRTVRLVDHLLVVDAGSVDATPDVLARLCSEYPQLLTERLAEQGPGLDAILQTTARHLTSRTAADYLLVLGPDDFLVAQDQHALRAALASLPAGVAGAIRRVTYVPMPGDRLDDPHPLRRITHRRAEPQAESSAPALPAAALGAAELAVGAGGQPPRAGYPAPGWTMLEGVVIAHLPVRSPAQLAARILADAWGSAARGGPPDRVARQWQAVNQLLSQDAEITADQLRDAALRYRSDDPPGLGPNSVDERLPTVHREPVEVAAAEALRWPELGEVRLAQALARRGSAQFSGLRRTVFANPLIAVGRLATCVLAYHRTDTVIGKSIEIYGEWAESELRLLEGFLASGDTAIDVGANIGTHAIAFASKVGPHGQVHAFEPQRLSFQLLCANAALNGMTNVFAHQLGIGDTPGSVRIPMPNLDQGENFGGMPLEGHPEGEEVAVTTLDSRSWSRVRLIKVDVEGMEARVLLGGRRLLAQHRPVLFLENNILEKSPALIALLLELGYAPYWHLAGYYNPDNYYGNQQNIFADVDRPEVNLLCLPRELDKPNPHPMRVAGPEDTAHAAYARLTGSRN